MQEGQKKTWWGEDPKNLIVRMPNWLGDLVMATPVLQDLKQRFPNATITAMCSEGLAGLLENDPHVDQILRFTKPKGWFQHLHHSQVLNVLHAGDYDCGVLLTNSLSSAWWMWRGGVARRLGFIGHWRRYLLNNALTLPSNYQTQHLVATYKMLLEPLGVALSDSMPTIYVKDAELEAARATLRNNGVAADDIVIGINPGAAYGSAKCWLPDRFRDLTLALLEQPNYRILYFGDRAGAPLVNDICAAMPERVINMAGKTNIRELAALIKCCRVLLTNDSGPMHMSAALGVPPLALFGSTSDVRTGPYKLGRVIHKHVECSPCYKRVCPIDFRCMKRIEVDEVLRNLREMIG
ncbi:MAG: lipopolysaccharide heptosyltransferase II [Chlamydiales bacterium]|nr:lipopolysaccharide heptosyltransferase II [Chlamydiales bacterium]